MKLKFLLFLMALVFAAQQSIAQNSVGIGTETPNLKAVLELIAINGDQGFLAPRLTTGQRVSFAANLTSNDNGMLVFDSDEGQFYVWYNAVWNPVGLSQLVAGAGISVAGQTITNTGDIDATDDVTITTSSAGDVFGRFDSLVVSGLKGLPLDSIAPSSGFSLVWNGSLWKFALDSASNQVVVPNANLLATNTQAALEELQVEILSITSGANSVGSVELIDGSIANIDINPSAAISGTKVSPNFGAQNIVTTGTISGASFTGDGSGLTNIPATPGPNTVGTSEISDGSIADIDINAAAAIAGTKINPDFGSQNIATTGAVTAGSFTGDGSGLTNIPATPGPSTVGTNEIIDGSIAFVDMNIAVVDGVTLASNGTSFEVRDNGISTAKVAALAISDAKISDVAPGKLSQSGATTGQVLKWTGSAWAPANENLGSLADGTLLIGDATNAPQEVVIGGDISIDNTGDAQILSNVITHDNVNIVSFVDGITVASNGSTFGVPVDGISSAEILDGTISDIDISDVDAGKIIGLGTAASLNAGTSPNNLVQLDGSGALPAIDGSALINISAPLGPNSVSSSEILDGTIVDADIANVSAVKVTGLGSAATLNAGTTTGDLLQLPSDGTLPAFDGSALVNLSAGQVNGLGTAATLDVGTAQNNVVQLDATGLPAVDGSQLTNVTATNFTGALAGDVTGNQGTTTIANGAVSGGTGGKIADNTITDDDISSISTAVITGLGTAAPLNVGTAANNVVQLDATGLPAVDGSQLTNVTATNFTGSLAGDVTGSQTSTVIANNAITTAKIADGQVTGGISVGAKIAPNTIVEGNMANNSIGLNALDEANIPLSALAPASAAISLNGNSITNVADPTVAQDAATKAYVDAGTVAFEDGPNGTLTAGILSGGLLSSGQFNVLYGRATGADLTTESNNTMMGWLAGVSATSSNNSMMGKSAGAGTTTGSDNTYVGFEAGAENVTGSNNVAIGSSAGPTIGASNFSGTVAIGNGAATTENNAIAIGSGASASADNAIAIGFNAAAPNANTLILGNGVNVGIGTTTPAVALDINATNAVRLPVGSDVQRPGTPLVGMIRYNSTLSQYEGYDGAIWKVLSATGIDGNISQDITFDQGNDRTISIAPATTGIGNDLVLTAGDGATNSDLGGDIVLNPGIQPGFLTPSDVVVNGAIRFNGPFGSPVAYANGDFQLEQGANRTIQVGNAVTGNGNNLTISAGGGQQFAGTTNGGNLTLKAGSPWSGGLFGDIFLQGNSVAYGAADGTYKVEFSDGSANGSVFNMLSLTNNNLGGVGTGVALSFRGSTNGSNRFDLGKISATKTSTTSGGMRFSVLTNTAGPTYVDAININGQGRVGIGTTTPAEVLDVAGNIRATDYFYPTAVTKILSISNKSFTVEGTTALATSGGSSGKRVQTGNPILAATLSAGVEFPNGATITQVDAFVIDNDATYDVSVQLVRGTHASITPITMTVISSTGQNASVQNLSDNTVVPATQVINNDLYFYYLTFQTQEANLNMALLSFRIYYTVQKVD